MKQYFQNINFLKKYTDNVKMRDDAIELFDPEISEKIQSEDLRSIDVRCNANAIHICKDEPIGSISIHYDLGKSVNSINRYFDELDKDEEIHLRSEISNVLTRLKHFKTCFEQKSNYFEPTCIIAKFNLNKRKWEEFLNKYD